MYDVVVVGAGVMGSATAYWLSRAGKRVALLEQFSPAHVRASSADESRTIRYQYRGQAAYTRMVAGAVELWKEFDRQSGTDFYRETGTLTLQTQPGLEPLLDGYQGLCDLGYTPRWLDASDVRREFPQFANVDSGYIMEGVGGYIAAGPATRALAEAAAEQGADVHTGAEVVELRQSGGRVTSVVTRDGRAFEGEVSRHHGRSLDVSPAPESPRPRATNRRSPALPEAGGSRLPYTYPRLTPFSVMDTQFYGFPVHWRGCVKVADDMIGEPFDPDRDREHEDPVALAKLRDFLGRHMPDLRDADVVYSKTCTYSMTPDSDFIIDRVPSLDNALVAAGFSGHGFKFGILIGQIMADLATRGATSWDLGRFRLSRETSAVSQHW